MSAVDHCLGGQYLISFFLKGRSSPGAERETILREASLAIKTPLFGFQIVLKL